MQRSIAVTGALEDAYVRFGSEADMCVAKRHVRFTPESGHERCNSGCPLWAKSGQQTVLFDHLIDDRQNGGGDRQP